MNLNNKSPYVNSVFEQSWWLEAVAPGRWEEILYKEKDEVIARYVIVKKGKHLYIPKYTQNIGIWIQPDILTNDIRFNKQKEINNYFIKEISKYKTFKLALNPVNQYFMPFVWSDLFIQPNISYRISDLSNLDEVFSRFNNSLKRNIKTAQKKVALFEEDNINALIELVRKTFALQNRKVSESECKLIDGIYKAAKSNNAAKLLFAKDGEGNYHSGALFVYDENVMYYLIPGSDPKFRDSRANSLIIWEGIKIASKVSKVFDFEGSSIETIEDFFRRYGGEPTVFYTVEKRSFFQHAFNFYRRKIKRILGYKQ